jgi:hypothetical protein
VSVAASSLAAGTYNATMTVDGNATNAPVTVSVQLTVTAVDPDPQIALSPGSLSFEVSEGSNPSNKSFTVQNSGGGTLSWSASDNASWLTLGTTSGSLASGASKSVQVSVASSSLAAGAYNGTVTVSGNAPNSPQAVAVQLTVTAVDPDPQIAVDPGSLAFETQEGSNPGPKNFTIQNSGGGTLNWSVGDDRNWLSVGPGSGSATGGSSSTAQVSVNAASLGAGTHTGTISVSGNAPNSPQTVTVQVTVAEVSGDTDPQIALSPTTMSFKNKGKNAPNDQPFTISNTGGSRLDWSASTDVSWLGLSPVSGSVNSSQSRNVVLSADITGLNPGSYSGTITVSGNAPNSPQTIAVDLTVTNGARVRVNRNKLAFIAPTGETASAESLVLTNDGDEDLEWSIEGQAAWLSFSTVSGVLAPSASVQLTVTADATNVDPGMYVEPFTIIGNAIEGPLSVEVELRSLTAPVTASSNQIVDHLLGRNGSLDGLNRQVIDEIGNRNGSFDIGDVRGWMIYEGILTQFQLLAPPGDEHGIEEATSPPGETLGSKEVQ